MKTYIILFQNIIPEIISATSPKEALKFLAIDDFKWDIYNWEKIEIYSVSKIMDMLNINMPDDEKVSAIYELGKFHAFSNL